MDSPTSRIPTTQVGIRFLVEKKFFCYHTNIIHIYIHMPGGKFEHAFDTSDVDADIAAEKESAAKKAEQKKVDEIKTMVHELGVDADQTIELNDEDIELFTEGADLDAPTAEDGTEMKTLLKEIQEDVHGTSEINQAMRDLKSVLAETPKENIAAVNKEIIKPTEVTEDMIEDEEIMLDDSDIEEITEEPTIEMTADYESDNEVMAENEAKITKLKKELDTVNQVVKKNPAAWGLQSARIANINKEISALEASNKQIKDSIVNLDDYRKKKNQRTSTTSAGGARIAV